MKKTALFSVFRSDPVSVMQDLLNIFSGQCNCAPIHSSPISDLSSIRLGCDDMGVSHLGRVRDELCVRATSLFCIQCR